MKKPSALQEKKPSALQEKMAKCGINSDRKNAGWDDNYLLKVLTG